MNEEPTGGDDRGRSTAIAKDVVGGQCYRQKGKDGWGEERTRDGESEGEGEGEGENDSEERLSFGSGIEVFVWVGCSNEMDLIV